MSICVIGERLLVAKEKIDLGGLRATPAVDNDGMSNKGQIVEVGKVSELNVLKGIVKGATVYFKKHFVANKDSDQELVFVNIEDVLAVEATI